MSARHSAGVTVKTTRKHVGPGIISGFGAGGRSSVEAIMKTTGQEAADVMQNVIDTTPSGIVAGKPDRNWTGKMRASVAYEIERTARGVYRLRVGWVNQTEDYFFWQDTGVPQREGQWEIEGMRMLFQGYLVAKEGVKHGISRSKLIGK